MNEKLSKDGSNFMLGRLDMNNDKIISVRDATFEDGDTIYYRVFQQERFNVRNLVNEGLRLWNRV